MLASKCRRRKALGGSPAAFGPSSPSLPPARATSRAPKTLPSISRGRGPTPRKHAVRTGCYKKRIHQRTGRSCTTCRAVNSAAVRVQHKIRFSRARSSAAAKTASKLCPQGHLHRSTFSTPPLLPTKQYDSTFTKTHIWWYIVHSLAHFEQSPSRLSGRHWPPELRRELTFHLESRVSLMSSGTVARSFPHCDESDSNPCPCNAGRVRYDGPQAQCTVNGSVVKSYRGKLGRCTCSKCKSAATDCLFVRCTA